jgi:hypothetical protein
MALKGMASKRSVIALIEYRVLSGTASQLEVVSEP